MKKVILHIGIVTSLTVSSWGANASDVFESAVNTTNEIKMDGLVYNESDQKLTGTTITNKNNTDTCKFEPDSTGEAPCTVSGSARTLITDVTFPANLATEVAIDYSLGGTLQVSEGNYSLLKSSDGTLSLDPGEYYIDVLDIGQHGDLQVTGTTGTVRLFIKSSMNIAGSDINCNPRADGNDPVTFAADNTPNRVFIYTAAAAADNDTSQACVSGYMYFVDDLWQVNYYVWGAVSADRFWLQTGGWIKDGTSYLSQTDFTPSDIVGNTLPGGWHLIGIPADMNGTVKFQDVFNEPEFGDEGNLTSGWFAFERKFNPSDNGSYYERVYASDAPNQSQGYWLWNANEVQWSVYDLDPVVWKIPYLTDDCQARNGCTDYNMTLPALGCSDTQNTGPLRYNYIGYPGSSEADWADFRIAVTDQNSNRNVYKPGDPEVETYMSTQIWKFNGTVSTQSNAYTSCDNSVIESCIVPPYTGFLVELNCSIADDNVSSIELIIPNGK